jgi:nitroreductase
MSFSREASSIQEIIRSRRTVHEYADGALPEGALSRAVEAALSAPNHRLTEPWRFIVAGPVTRQALLAIGMDVATEGGRKPLTSGFEGRLKRTVINPAQLLIVSQVLHEDPAVRQEDYAAVACAIQNLTLSLWAEGIGSKWSTERLMSHPRVYAALDIEPAREAIVAVLWIGYAAREDAPKARRRKALEQVLRQLP